jgi:hypothetical protein
MTGLVTVTSPAAQRGTLIALDEFGNKVGFATLNAPRGRWTIEVYPYVRYTRKRRSAQRKLAKLVRQVLRDPRNVAWPS